MSSQDYQLGYQWLTDAFDVGEEKFDRFSIYHSLLLKWQPVQNLVSRETLSSFWTRHICDSAALMQMSGPNGIWLDMGSGAGFPGLVIAILQKQLSDDPSAKVHLVESNMRKVSFLRTVIRETGINAEVHACRAEEFVGKSDFQPDFISARAFTALHHLLSLSETYVSKGAVCFFHKGRDINGEIAEAANKFDFDLIKHKQTLPLNHLEDGVIAEVRAITRKTQ